MQERNGQPSGQPTPEPWSDGLIARYLTVAGATVDITYASHSGLLAATCTGCGDVERTDTGGLLSDPPEKEDARIEKALPESRELAQAHAEKCRALPHPAVPAREPQTDGTPTNDPAAALHWAAVAYGLAEAREQQGHFLTSDEQAAFTRYQSAARSHGFTDEQVRDHAKTLGRPAVNA